MVSRLDFFILANKLISQYRIYVEMAFLTDNTHIYKSFELVKAEMTIFPKLFFIKEPKQTVL